MSRGSIYLPGDRGIGRGIYRPGANRIGGTSGVLGGASNPASFAPGPAPAGFHWEFVTDATNGNARVTDATHSNQPVVSLVRN